jgi:peptidoglycan/LPS O-acetylase OafA/YrhL
MSVAISAPVRPQQAAEAQQNVSESHYNVAIGYLRAFVTVLVIAHHAVLAYHPFAPSASPSFAAEPRLWRMFPIVDRQRWSGFSYFIGFNDTFFMSLMFFLSGLFVWNSLQRKGGGAFVRDRFLRLGLPFVAGAVLIAPLAYYPSYLAASTHPSVGDFARQWISQGDWPAGPAWFLWVLLAFDCLAGALYAWSPQWGEILGRMASGASGRPAAFFGLLVAVSAAAYIPMELAFHPFAWSVLGPFAFQTSRLLHYAVYFLAGIGVGAWGLERGLLARDGKLARRWVLWLLAALPAYALLVVVVIAAFASPTSPILWGTIGGFSFALSCAASGFAFLALFVRFRTRPRKAFDSVRDNAYGMYVIHYAFASWLQYALLSTAMPGWAKGWIAFCGTLALSWIAVAAVRRTATVARVL